MDLRLPGRLAAILDRAVAAAENDPLAFGLVVNGSCALGTADDYSDLDLVVLYGGDGSDLDLPGRARRFAAELGDVLVAFTGEHVGAPNLIVALLADPVVHVDVKCELVADQGSRVEDGVVAWERDGAVQRARAGTAAQWPQPDPQWIEDRVWQIAPDRVPQLHATLAGAEAGQCLEALLATADLYREVRPPGLVTHDAAEEAVRAYVERLCRAPTSRTAAG